MRVWDRAGVASLRWRQLGEEDKRDFNRRAKELSENEGKRKEYIEQRKAEHDADMQEEMEQEEEEEEEVLSWIQDVMVDFEFVDEVQKNRKD